MMVRARLGYCLVAAIFNLATERMGQISAARSGWDVKILTKIDPMP